MASEVVNLRERIEKVRAEMAGEEISLDNKNILEHCLISHLSSEPGHKGVILKLKKEPILDLNMKLGEASGGAVAALIIKAALVTHNKMATFSQAGVSKKI